MKNIKTSNILATLTSVGLNLALGLMSVGFMLGCTKKEIIYKDGTPKSQQIHEDAGGDLHTQGTSSGGGDYSSAEVEEFLEYVKSFFPNMIRSASPEIFKEFPSELSQEEIARIIADTRIDTSGKVLKRNGRVLGMDYCDAKCAKEKNEKPHITVLNPMIQTLRTLLVNPQTFDGIQGYAVKYFLSKLLHEISHIGGVGVKSKQDDHYSGVFAQGLLELMMNDRVYCLGGSELWKTIKGADWKLKAKNQYNFDQNFIPDSETKHQSDFGMIIIPSLGKWFYSKRKPEEKIYLSDRDSIGYTMYDHTYDKDPLYSEYGGMFSWNQFAFTIDETIQAKFEKTLESYFDNYESYRDGSEFVYEEIFSYANQSKGLKNQLLSLKTQVRKNLGYQSDEDFASSVSGSDDLNVFHSDISFSKTLHPYFFELFKDEDSFEDYYNRRRRDLDTYYFKDNFSLELIINGQHGYDFPAKVRIDRLVDVEINKSKVNSQNLSASKEFDVTCSRLPGDNSLLLKLFNK